MFHYVPLCSIRVEKATAISYASCCLPSQHGLPPRRASKPRAARALRALPATHTSLQCTHARAVGPYDIGAVWVCSCLFVIWDHLNEVWLGFILEVELLAGPMGLKRLKCYDQTRHTSDGCCAKMLCKSVGPYINVSKILVDLVGPFCDHPV